MIRRRRALAFSVLALVVPLPAFAVQNVTGSNEQSLSVNVSLDRCGLIASQITCRINASWNAIDGADHYSVTVIRPDGSVSEMGDVAGTSASLWVEYAGTGNYSVEVSAWGNASESELLVTQQVGEEPSEHRIGNFTVGDSNETPDEPAEQPDVDQDPTEEPATDPVVPEEPAGCDPTAGEATTPDETATVETTSAEVAAVTTDAAAEATAAASDVPVAGACTPAP